MYFINSWLVQVQMSFVRLKTIQKQFYLLMIVSLFHLTEMLHLDREATSYAYLNKSGCSTLAAVDDKEQFNVTIVSFFLFFFSQSRFVSRVLQYNMDACTLLHHAEQGI